MDILEHSIKNKQDIDLKIKNHKHSENKTPLYRPQGIQYLEPKSVFKKTIEYKSAMMTTPSEKNFTSEFERHIYKRSLEQDTIYDAFSGTWKNFNDFVVSIFATYFKYTNNLNSIIICAKCGKLHIPERNSKKNSFCSDPCRKKHRQSKHKDLCRRRQYDWLNSRAIKITTFFLQKKIKDYEPIFNSFTQEELCIYKCSHEDILAEKTPKGGSCTTFMESNLDLMNIHEIIKNKKHNDKEKIQLIKDRKRGTSSDD